MGYDSFIIMGLGTKYHRLAYPGGPGGCCPGGNPGGPGANPGGGAAKPGGGIGTAPPGGGAKPGGWKS
jgi:hypothetical protein